MNINLGQELEKSLSDPSQSITVVSKKAKTRLSRLRRLFFHSKIRRVVVSWSRRPGSWNAAARTTRWRRILRNKEKAGQVVKSGLQHFLDAPTHLYKRVCQSVRRSVAPSQKRRPGASNSRYWRCFKHSLDWKMSLRKVQQRRPIFI